MPISLSAQTYLGSNRLLHQIGLGRHCSVWDAMIDSKSERRAIKILQKLDKEQLNLMKHEFEVGKNLDHMNVIHIHEFNIVQDTPYLAMEYFPSINLKQFLQQKGLTEIAPKIPSILEQAALGLNYFHEQGWIHRDIKPDNYLINEAGKIKLIDFALAERQKGFFGRLLNRTKSIAGTRSYISPEQIRCEALDSRSDIYSFGCMAYELTVGRVPFTGSTTQELLNKHLRSTPTPMEALNKNIGTGFSALIKRMLSKSPKDRPSSLAEVAATMKNDGIFK